MTAMSVSEGVRNVSADLTPAESRHLEALERRIERGLNTFREVGAALAEIRNSRLYRMTHTTFRSYCNERWAMAESRAHQLIGASEVAEVLGGDGFGPKNEVQARELVPILHTDPKLVPKVWEAVRATGQPITGPVIRRVAGEVTGMKQVAEADPVTNLVSRIDGVYAAVVNWRKGKPTAKEKSKVKSALENLCSLIE